MQAVRGAVRHVSLSRSGQPASDEAICSALFLPAGAGDDRRMVVIYGSSNVFLGIL